MKIEFIIPTYNRPNHLMCTINSIIAQRSDKWSIHVVGDCPPDGTLDKIIEYFKGDERVRFTLLPDRHNDWGHTPRNYGLEHAKEEWVVMTGEDNYYMPVFVDHFLSIVTPDTNFVYCDMIHNWTNFQYHHIICKPAYGSIDIGNYMFKRDLGQQLRLNPKIEQADFFFMDEYLKKFPEGEVKKVEKVLYVHN